MRISDWRFRRVLFRSLGPCTWQERKWGVPSWAWPWTGGRWTSDVRHSAVSLHNHLTVALTCAHDTHDTHDTHNTHDTAYEVSVVNTTVGGAGERKRVGAGKSM